MTKIKLWLKEKWYYVLAGLALIGGIIASVLVFSRPSTNDGESLPSSIQKSKDKLHENITKARIDAAVEMATAKGQEDAVKEEVKKIVEITEKDKSKEAKRKQLEQLAVLAKRTY